METAHMKCKLTVESLTKAAAILIFNVLMFIN